MCPGALQDVFYELLFELLFFSIYWGRARWHPKQWTELKSKHSNIKMTMLISNQKPQATAALMGRSKASNSNPYPNPALRTLWKHQANESQQRDMQKTPKKNLNNIYKMDAQCWSKG